MISLKKIFVSTLAVSFWLAPLASADSLDDNYVEKFFYDSENEEFITQEANDRTAASPFAIEETYWTKERMINAMPYPQQVLDGEPMALETLDSDYESLEAGAEDGSLSLADKANLDAGLSLFSEEKGAIAIAGGDRSALAYPPPHNTFYVPTSKYKSYPYYTVGKVFFTSGGGNYVCSGSSAGGRAVLTAGHCVGQNGTWHTNWRFAPAYRNGSTPYGTWTAFWKVTFTSWLNNRSLCRDVAFAAVYDRGGQKLSQAVGYLGFAWNYSRNQSWTMFGYPAASPWDGSKMVRTDARFNRQDNPSGCTPATMGMGTTQTGGCSGGPWVWKFKDGFASGNNYANGVNSYVYTAKPLEIFSPYFDTSVKSMKDTAVAK